MSDLDKPISYQRFLNAIETRELDGTPVHLDELHKIADGTLERGEHVVAAKMFRELANHLKHDAKKQIELFQRRAAAILNVDRHLLEANHYEWTAYREVRVIQGLADDVAKDFVISYSPEGKDSELWQHFRDFLSINESDPASWLHDFSNGIYRFVPISTADSFSKQRDYYVTDQAATSLLKAFHQFVEEKSRKYLYGLMAGSDQMKPLPLPWLKVEGGDHYMVLRESNSGGLFLAGDSAEANVTMREPFVDELAPLSKVIPHRLQFLLGAPRKDPLGNRTIASYSRARGCYFVETRSDGKKSGWRAEFIDGFWEVVMDSNANNS